MSPIRLPNLAPALLALVAFGGRAEADVVVQTAPFNYSFNAFDGTSQSAPLVPSGDMSAVLSPFNAALGTLNSFRVEWSFGYTFNGTTGSSGGGFSMGFGGSAAINGSPYNGNGDGGGNAPIRPSARARRPRWTTRSSSRTPASPTTRHSWRR